MIRSIGFVLSAMASLILMALFHQWHLLAVFFSMNLLVVALAMRKQRRVQQSSRLVHS